MSDIQLIFLLFSVGVVLVFGEIALPTHGALGVIGVGCILGSIGKTFWVNQWAGVGFAVAAACSIPFAWQAMLKIWPKTFIGKRLLLQPVVTVPEPPEVHIGQAGTAISELRPMGVCDFEGRRVEAITEIGTIPAGTKVVVAAIHNRRPTVRRI